MTSFIPSRWVFLAIFSIAALAVVAAWALSPMRVAHAEQPGEIELSISLANDFDGVVQAGDRVQVRAELRFLVEPQDRNGDGEYDIITHNELLLGQPLDSGRSWLRLSGGYTWDGRDSSASFQEQLQLNLSNEAPLGSDLATVDARDLEDSTSRPTARRSSSAHPTPRSTAWRRRARSTCSTATASCWLA